LKSTFGGLQLTTLSLMIRAYFIHVAVAASQICEIARNSPKIRTSSNSMSTKVIGLGANPKRICNFLLVINSNFGRIPRIFYRFPDIDAFCSKIAHSPHPTLV